MSTPIKTKAEIKKITRYCDGITQFSLIPEKYCKFKSGQFLHLAIDEYDPSFNWPESRVFSIANSPLRSKVIEILISPKGSFTKRMINDLKEGDEVWIKLPFGIFNFNDALNSDCILIAGGTGISPFVSFLQYLIDSQHNLNSLNLFYGVRQKDLIIFNDLLSECCIKLPNFNYYIYIEQNEVNSGENFFKGILPVAEIVEKTKILSKPIYYLSGPKTMISMFNNELSKNKISQDNIYFDKWE